MVMRIGVLGGSGLYHLFDGEAVTEKRLETPFGSPSDAFFVGRFHQAEIVFLPRHGRHHSLLPDEVNYRANIYGMKMLGVTHLLSISAVGSLKENIHPRDVVVVDQFFDRTSKRPMTFFGEGCVAHVPLGDPVCPLLRERILNAVSNLDGTFHREGTYVNMEGPQFSTRAESRYYRAQGFDVIGMTNFSEARLAREAEICYATLAFVTDFDCWHDEEESVTTEAVLQVLRDNADHARRLVGEVVGRLLEHPYQDCPVCQTLNTSLVTPMDQIPESTRVKLAALFEKHR